LARIPLPPPPFHSRSWCRSEPSSGIRGSRRAWHAPFPPPIIPVTRTRSGTLAARSEATEVLTDHVKCGRQVGSRSITIFAPNGGPSSHDPTDDHQRFRRKMTTLSGMSPLEQHRRQV